MRNFTLFRRIRLGICLAILGASPVVAGVIAPGQPASLSGTSAASDTSLNGTVVAQSDETFQALLLGYGPVLFNAELQSSVVRETATGTLDFYYQVINNNTDAGIQFVGHVTVSSYAGLGADVDFRTDEGGQFFPQSAFRDPSGAAIEFSGFTGDISGGDFPALDETAPFFVRTDATNFSSEGTAFVQFEDTNVNGPPLPGYATVTAFAPIAVPEPKSFWIVVIGFSLAIAMIKRRCRRPRPR